MRRKTSPDQFVLFPEDELVKCKRRPSTEEFSVPRYLEPGYAATKGRKAIATVQPVQTDEYAELYEKWKARLYEQLNVIGQKDVLSMGLP